MNDVEQAHDVLILGQGAAAERLVGRASATAERNFAVEPLKAPRRLSTDC